MAFSTSQSQAAEAAKKLVGQWPHLKADNPEVFIRTIAAVLSEYPAGIVQECIDPRTGPVNKLKFLSIADLRPWLDARLEHHRTLAAWRPRPTVAALPPPPTLPPEHRAGMVERFRALLGRMSRAQDPVTSLIRAHRKQAQQRLAADRARALASLEAAE